MNNYYFGTDGIRGVVNQTLSPNLSFFVGKALGVFIKKSNKVQDKPIIIAMDTRESSNMIKFSFCSGAMSMGVNIVDVGILPTPGLSYLTSQGNYSFGVMITASHNSSEYNGIKIFDENGFKLNSSIEITINNIIKNINRYHFSKKIGNYKFSCVLSSIWYTHINKIFDNLDLTNINILLDCANGAGSYIIPKIFKNFGANVVSININPDGKNINKECGSTNLNNIKKLMVNGEYDIGFSYDGDADRIVCLDKRGIEYTGEEIIFILAKSMIQEDMLSNNTITTTIISNTGLDLSLKNFGIKVNRVNVGDKNVIEDMRNFNLKLGGEESGHIILADYNNTADAVIASVMLTKIFINEGKSFDNILKHYEKMHTKKINIPIDKSKKEYILAGKFDNIIKNLEKKLEKDERILLRLSGTEPVVRVLIESNNSEKSLNIINFIQNKISSL